MKKNTNELLRVIYILGLLSLVHAQNKPNIIFFLVDDMGLHDTSVPFGADTSAQNRWFETPVMERLTQSGIKFTRAYAHSVCSPSRISLLTGKNPTRHQVTNWTLFSGTDQSGTTAQLKSPDWNLLGFDVADSASTLPSLIRAQGYRTIHAGKAHFGVHGNPNEDPTNLGFDVNIAGHASGGPGSFRGLDNYSALTRPISPCNCPEWDVPGLEEFHGQDVHLTDALTIKAKREVITSHEMGKPFYLYMSHYAIHAPWHDGHKPYYSNYESKRGQFGKSVEDARFASMMEGVDASLGELLDLVDSLGIAENTIVLFTSDNGGARTNVPLRAKKGTMYEGGLRVPLIVSWAKNSVQNSFTITPNSVSHKNVVIEDYFPTLVNWAGGTLKPSIAAYQEGQDISDFVILNNNAARDQERLYFHFPHSHNGPHASAMIKGDLKIIYFYENNRWELYDVMKDVGEQNNLSTSNPRDLYIMAKELENGFEERAVQYPIQKSDNQERNFTLPNRPAGLTEGCLDPKYSEYDSNFDIHDQRLCINLGIENNRVQEKIFEISGNNIILLKSENLSLVYFNLNGREIGNQRIEDLGSFPIPINYQGLYVVRILNTSDNRLIGNYRIFVKK